jgi:hypothetical protein
VHRQVERVYWLTLSRAPTKSQRQAAADFIEQRFRSSMQSLLDRHVNTYQRTQELLRRKALADFCRVMLNANEFVYLDWIAPPNC